jgi:FMN phosphatase YigB (HAD superfamily)
MTAFQNQAARFDDAQGLLDAAIAAERSDVVFLLDCDNTLLDNDRIVSDLKIHLADKFGAASSEMYWRIFEDLRTELGYADYLGALQRYRIEGSHNCQMLRMSSFLVDYPFAERLYPGALEVIAHLGQWGPTVILTDGDVVFQPRKIERSGLWQAVDSRVLIYIHKEQMLDDVERHYPAWHYIMIDDKLRILNAMKSTWHRRLSTIQPRQGHYALDPAIDAAFPAADLGVDRIGALLSLNLATLLGSNNVITPIRKLKEQHEPK